MKRARKLSNGPGRKWAALGVTVAALAVVGVAAGTASGWQYKPHHNNYYYNPPSYHNYYPSYPTYYPVYPLPHNDGDQNVNVNTGVNNNALVDIDNYGSSYGGYGYPYNCDCYPHYPYYGGHAYQPTDVDINQGATVGVNVADYGSYPSYGYPYYGYPYYGYGGGDQNVNVNTMVNNNALVSIDNGGNPCGYCGYSYGYPSYGGGYQPVDVDINQGATVSVNVLKDVPYNH